MAIKNVLDSLFIKVLTEEAGRIAASARQNASWSSHIPKAIKVTPATKEDSRYEISIIVDLKDAPMAAAFEYGSGLHKKDNPSLYPIEAKNSPNLVFWWEKRGKLFVGPRLPYGHPGVSARPYMKPAIDAWKPTIKSRLVSVFKRGLLDAIRVEFKND